MPTLDGGARDGGIAQPPACGGRRGCGRLDAVARSGLQDPSAGRLHPRPGRRALRGPRGLGAGWLGGCGLVGAGRAGVGAERLCGGRRARRGGGRRLGGRLRGRGTRRRRRHAGDQLVRTHHAQLARVLHPHGEGAALLVGRYDFERSVPLEGRPRPAHLAFTLTCARSERQECNARRSSQGPVPDSSHGLASFASGR
ncbi:MAG: hypothetical protein E6K32_02505 [Gammaproteobacteria bacterium]|nr:MAG: hypothetical protein E6K32_02505 [Gammaproteobacteria bacterium]